MLALFTVIMLVTGGLTVGFTKRHLDNQLRSELLGAVGSTTAITTLGGPGVPTSTVDGNSPTASSASASGSDANGGQPGGGHDDDRPGRHGPAPRDSSAVLRLTLVANAVAIDSDGSALATITAYGNNREQLTAAQIETLATASPSLIGRDERIDLGDSAGTYLVTARTDGDTTWVVGVPTASVDRTLLTLAELVGLGLLLGLVAVGFGGNWLIKRNLAPLERVADTAREVSALKLDSGDVRLPARVAAADATPYTEVGQVGQALNTLLDNVEDALQTRQDSEMRVRQFVADASHELRTPLASIRGYAELSRRERDPVPATVTHALGRVESEALRMQGLVEDLLLLARLDSGRPLEHDTVDLSMLVLDVVGDAHAAAPEHHWRLDLPEDPVEVTGDRARLHQVLANLLANARTHTPAGTTVVTKIRVVGEVVALSVADNGPGISEELRPRVFERFTRGDDSRNRASGSTGLGLSIVAAVAGAHGGQVEVESGPGGTTFTVTLPRAAQ